MNPTMRSSIERCGLGILLAAALAFPSITHAAPGPLAQVPLYLSVSVQPNIFFVLDDSTSMDSDVLKSTGAEVAHPFYFAEQHLHYPLRFDFEPEPLYFCAGYNVLAFDPNASYSPWAGKDKDGNEYTDRTLATALSDPFDPTSRYEIPDPDAPGNMLDLADIGLYFPWTDLDGDGDYDVGECPLPDGGDFGGDITVDECPLAGCIVASSLAAEDQVNFANWFTYYRKREYVLKAAVGAMVSGSRQRMGMASMWNTGDVSTPVRDMTDTNANNLCECVGAGCAPMTNRDCMLRKLYGMDAAVGGGTPLRRALAEAGMYFHETDGLYHEFLGPGESSPILSQLEGGDCQQNFAIVVSDGLWNGIWPTSRFGALMPPPATDTAGQVLSAPNDADSDGNNAAPPEGPPWDGGAQADGVTKPACIFAVDTSNTLADIAMHYYETDLSPNDNNLSIIPNVDYNQQQHLVTFMVAFGVDGTLRADPPEGDRETPFDWPAICPSRTTTIDDMRHAAWNARGRFLSARAPSSVSQALAYALASITRRQGTGSPAAFNANRITAGSLLFQARFNANRWSGDLLAFDAVAAVADIADDGSLDIDPVWSGADELDAVGNLGDRFVMTRGTNGLGALVTWDDLVTTWNNLTPEQQADLRSDRDGVQGADEVGRARLAYLIGDRSCEVQGDGACGTDINGDTLVDNRDKTLRQRDSRLGDMVNSGPIVVGVPELDWPSDGFFAYPVTYEDWRDGLKANPRDEVVYIGGNDGMLHGFDTRTGREVLAYLPSSLASANVFEGYHFLSEHQYTHRYYVDLTPTVSDAYIKATVGGNTSWRTVLIGGLGAGGRGLFALDITNPNTFTATAQNAEDIVLWEFNSSDDIELGHTLSESVVALMENGQWAVIVGSGYNDAVGANPNAHLFILFLEEGIDGQWSPGDYVKLEVNEPSATLDNPNGLSSPTVIDTTGDGRADRAYAGDLFGNLWAFDLRGGAAGDWKVAGNGQPLFTATDSGGKRQPITVKPVVSRHPSQSDTAWNWPNALVYFGTGQYLVDSDRGTTDDQAFYGVWDRDDYSLSPAVLEPQSFNLDFTNYQVLEDDPVTWADEAGVGEYGWYIELPDSGERVAVNPVFRIGILYFNSLLPSTDKCTGGGSGFQYAVDPENGAAPDYAVFDVDGINGIEDENDMATSIDGLNEAHVSRMPFNGGKGIPSRPTFYTTPDGDFRKLTFSTAEHAEEDAVDPGFLQEGRLSWQELFRF